MYIVKSRTIRTDGKKRKIRPQLARKCSNENRWDQSEGIQFQGNQLFCHFDYISTLVWASNVAHARTLFRRIAFLPIRPRFCHVSGSICKLTARTATTDCVLQHPSVHHKCVRCTHRFGSELNVPDDICRISLRNGAAHSSCILFTWLKSPAETLNSMRFICVSFIFVIRVEVNIIQIFSWNFRNFGNLRRNFEFD